MSDAIYRIKTMMGGLGKSEVKLHMLPFQSSKLRYTFFPEAQAHTHTLGGSRSWLTVTLIPSQRQFLLQAFFHQWIFKVSF